MKEEFILNLIPIKIKELGYEKYHVRYRDLTINKESITQILAYNELYFIVEDPQGIQIESEYGIYDSTEKFISDNTHIHKGVIEIANSTAEAKRVKFIQVIIVS